MHAGLVSVTPISRLSHGHCQFLLTGTLLGLCVSMPEGCDKRQVGFDTHGFKTCFEVLRGAINVKAWIEVDLLLSSGVSIG